MEYAKAGKNVAVKRYADLAPVLSALDSSGIQGCKIVEGTYSKNGRECKRYLIQNSEGRLFDYRNVLFTIKNWGDVNEWKAALKNEDNWIEGKYWAASLGRGVQDAGFQDFLSSVPIATKRQEFSCKQTQTKHENIAKPKRNKQP